MRVLVRGGTVNHGEPPLCSTCRFATIARGRSLREVVGFCAQMPYTDRRIRFAVTECSEYSDRRQPSLYQMEELAWVLRSSPSRKTVGFISPRRMSHEERHVIEE